MSLHAHFSSCYVQCWQLEKLTMLWWSVDPPQWCYGVLRHVVCIRSASLVHLSTVGQLQLSTYKILTSPGKRYVKQCACLLNSLYVLWLGKHVHVLSITKHFHRLCQRFGGWSPGPWPSIFWERVCIGLQLILYQKHAPVSGCQALLMQESWPACIGNASRRGMVVVFLITFVFCIGLTATAWLCK